MSKFKRATAKNVAIKCLLIGPEGSGKTKAMLSFPALAVIDTEAGTDLFARNHAFDVLHTKSLKETVEAVNEAIKGQYESIGIDSMTPIYNTLLNAAEGAQRDGSLSAKQWGTIKRTCSKLVDALMVKAKQHVVCTAWVKDKYAKPGTVINGRTVGAQEMVTLGEMADFDKKLGHAFDFVFRMDNSNGYVARVIKARGDIWPAGKELVFTDKSFFDVLLAELGKQGVTIGTDARHDETEETAAVKDQEIFEDPIPTVAQLSDLFDEARALGLLEDLTLGAYLMRTIEGFTPQSRLTGATAVQVRTTLKQILQTPAA